MKKGTLSLLLTFVAGSAASPVEHAPRRRASALVTARVHSAEDLRESGAGAGPRPESLAAESAAWVSDALSRAYQSFQERRGASSAMPVVRHDKLAGNGYRPGSPLYAKQEALGASGEIPGPRSTPSHGASGGWPNPDPYEDYEKWKDDPFEEWKAKLRKLLNLGAATSVYALMQIGFVCLFAFLYMKYYTLPFAKVTRPSYATNHGKFHFSLFECDARGDPGCCCTCLMSFFCLPIRWSETVSHSSMMGYGLSFWPALLTMLVLPWLTYCATLLTMLVLPELSFFTGGLLFVVLALQVYYRQQIRKAKEHAGVYSPSCKTCCMDTLTWCCCAPCAALQEAREVELVKPKEARMSRLQVNQRIFHLNNSSLPVPTPPVSSSSLPLPTPPVTPT